MPPGQREEGTGRRANGFLTAGAPTEYLYCGVSPILDSPPTAPKKSPSPACCKVPINSHKGTHRLASRDGIAGLPAPMFSKFGSGWFRTKLRENVAGRQGTGHLSRTRQRPSWARLSTISLTALPPKLPVRDPIQRAGPCPSALASEHPKSLERAPHFCGNSNRSLPPGAAINARPATRSSFTDIDYRAAVHILQLCVTTGI